MLSLILACVGGDTAPTGDDTDTTVTEPEHLAPEPAAYDGACPDISGTSFTIESAGQSRDLLIRLPDDPVGAPVLFIWHPLGGTASYAIQAFGMDDLADQGWVIIAPETAKGNNKPAFEWGFLGTDEMATADLAVYDDTLACLYEQHDIDLDRVYTSGFSAGGLWASYLAVHRSESLAAVAPYSGGAGELVDYATPEHTLPTMLVWGGTGDTWQGISFNDANVAMSSALQDDGHFVIECNHGSGHTAAPSWTDWTAEFFLDHPYGTDPSPYLDGGLPGSFPAWCEIP